MWESPALIGQSQWQQGLQPAAQPPCTHSRLSQEVQLAPDSALCAHS